MDNHSSILNFVSRFKEKIILKRINKLCIHSRMFNESGLNRFTVEDKFRIAEMIELNNCIISNIKNYSSVLLLDYLKSSSQILSELNEQFQKCQKCTNFNRCKELLYKELYPLIKSEEVTISTIQAEKYFRKFIIIDDLENSHFGKFNEDLK